jgi:dipeptidase
MVAELPADPGRPARAWVALGSPCVSVYVPIPLIVSPGNGPASSPVALPSVVTDAGTWWRFAAVRHAVGSDAEALGTVRAELSVLEDALWDEADALDASRAAWEAFGVSATRRVGHALDRLAAAGIGTDGPRT